MDLELSGKVARVIYGRLAGAMPGSQVTPEGILKLRPDRMRRLGLSRQKTAYIRDLARQTAKGKIIFEVLPELPDEEMKLWLDKRNAVNRYVASLGFRNCRSSRIL